MGLGGITPVAWDGGGGGVDDGWVDGGCIVGGIMLGWVSRLSVS
jgi:hypothetical protein